MKIKLLLLCAFLTRTVMFGASLADKFDEYIEQEVKAENFMGSVLVARSNQVVFIKGYGLASREHNVSNAPDTKFRLGSITKQFTAVCILKLQEQGKLSVDDPVSQFVPDSPTNWAEVKIRHLLSHTSGISNFTDFPDYESTAMLPSPPEKTVLRFRDKPLQFKPGDKFSYSNSGYILLGYIVEKASGKSYEDYCPDSLKMSPFGLFENVPFYAPLR